MDLTAGAPIEVFTIGFTQKNAEEFFTMLKNAGIQRVVDVRLNNTGQLAGFTKRNDLAFFLRSIGGIGYLHLPILAPTAEMLRSYRTGISSWEAYAHAFTLLMQERRIETAVWGEIRAGDCLLCSEPTAAHCHRRIVAEYLQEHWKRVRFLHL